MKLNGCCVLALAAVWMGTAPPALAAPAPAAAAAPQGRLAPRPDGVEVHRGALLMRVTAITDNILRVRIGRDGALDEDASWAVPADVRARHAPVNTGLDGFATASLRVHVDRRTLRLTVEDLSGRIISADADDPVRLDGRAFTLEKRLAQPEHIFGLGDKTGDLDRRGQTYVDWNTDAYAFMRSTDPIYKSIPFFLSVGGEGGSYGILLDNTWRTWFDFGHRAADRLAVGGPDGPIDYYLIAGPSMGEVVRRYTDLTGKAPLPPKWAFGYQQSRYSYMSDAEVRQIARRLRLDKIPTDVIWLDIDYQDRNRPFTVNRETFPDMPKLARDLKQDGINLVAITDLHIARAPGEGYVPYDSGHAGRHFARNPDGSEFVGQVWPGPSVFPDFTDVRARRWWGGLYRNFVDQGIAGFWNDMNEPSVFENPTKTMPLDAVHRLASDDFKPRDATHAEIHNVFGMLNTRATYEGVLALRPDERPFVMTRASYAGGQRYSVTWTGDNSATWDHLKLSVHQLINLGLSGFAYSAADVGGFTGGPSADLLTRWFEIGAFTPVFRDHAVKGSPRAEPWVDGPEHLAIRRRFINERYRLLPYLYALADENARVGDPIMRPVFYDFPALLNATCDQSMAFAVGRDLLVAPPPHPESPQSYDVCLPAGGWYDYWTGQPISKEGELDHNARTVPQTPKLERLPVFVRAGAILPHQPLVQSTSEVPAGPLSLDIYPGDDCRGTLYADDGHSMAYLRGGFLRQPIRCAVTQDGLRLEFGARQGNYAPWWKEMTITVHGWQGGATASIAGRSVPVLTDADGRAITITLPDQGGESVLLLVRR
jgi:alpha-glucosidase